MAASFTDLMASLMVIFVLLFVATANNQRQAEEEARKGFLTEMQADLVRQFEHRGLDPRSIVIDPQDPFALLILKSEEHLKYDCGEFRFKPSPRTGVRDGAFALLGDDYLNELIPGIAEVVCTEENRDLVDFILVEGHTDTARCSEQAAGPTDALRDTHLKLSQDRSMYVVLQSLKALDPAQRNCMRPKLSAAGRGQEDPDPKIKNPEEQRRVIFKIRARPDVATRIHNALGGARSATASAGIPVAAPRAPGAGP